MHQLTQLHQNLRKEKEKSSYTVPQRLGTRWRKFDTTGSLTDISLSLRGYAQLRSM